MNPQVRDAAQQYLDSANMLFRQGAFSGVLLPLVVNAAFSIELHLKALNSADVYNEIENDDDYLVTAKSNVHGHDFEKLFNSLPAEVRNDLKRKYAEDKNLACTSLPDVMKKYSKTFVNFRYIFEDSGAIESMNITEIIHLANFIGSYEANT